MYFILLALHSLVRWLVLSGLLLSIVCAYRGWILKKAFSRSDNALRHWTATIAHIQLVIGLLLYFISPVVHYFVQHYKNAVHQSQIRFFGMEHSSMMLLAIIIMTIGSARAKRQKEDNGKFKTIAIWFTIALLIILFSIPWPFSPFASRPYFRFI